MNRCGFSTAEELIRESERLASSTQQNPRKQKEQSAKLGSETPDSKSKRSLKAIERHEEFLGDFGSVLKSSVDARDLRIGKFLTSLNIKMAGEPSEDL